MSAVPGGTVALVAPTTTQPSPSQTATVALNENQAAVVEAREAGGAAARYWIRCLPNDFPPITAAPHPAVGTPTPGWYLVGNNFVPAGTRSYAIILDSRGTPVWYKRSALNALNVTPLGHDSLAFISTTASFGFGVDANGRYDVYSLGTGQSSTIRTVGVPTDLHELYAPANGHYLLLSYALKRGVDLTGLLTSPPAGPNSTIADCVVQDIDPQGGLVWQWTASDHIDPVSETTLAPSANINGETVYDVYHCNSIDARATGDLLVSARHLNAVFEIRRSDGRVVWKLGGKPVNQDGASIIAIQNDPVGSPVMQHDARYLPGGHISLYDNRNVQGTVPARVIEYALNLVTKTALPVFSYSTPNGPSCCMGSFRRYADGHSLIGWGHLPSGGNGRVFTELNASGQSVFDVRFATGHASYRAVKVPPPRFDINTLRATAGQ
jgi:arylsulfotransferase ASST